MARDYQSGQMRATAGQIGRRQAHVDFPAVIEADAAKALAQSSLARQWARRERLTLRLSPEFLDLAPGDVVRLASGSQDWRVDRATIEQMVVVAELKRVWREASALPAEAGRAVGNYDVVAPPTSIALFDLPDLGIAPNQAPTLQIAAASGAREWRPMPVEISINGVMSAGHSAIGETVMGIVTTAPAPGQAAVIDELAILEVEMVSDAMWLMSCDDIALCEGANLAIVGNELIQFGRADPIGPNQFRLWRLLRGRRGTEWATQGHVAGERFAIVESDALRTIELGQASLGAEVSVRARGLGDGDAALPVSRIAAGEALRPPSPVHLTAVRRADNGLDINWVRRSRFGWAWVDSVDVPLGETVERYQVRVSSAAGVIEFGSAMASSSIPAAEVASLGPGSAIITVRQIGDFAASHESALTIVLP